jgi:hypothetical protein
VTFHQDEDLNDHGRRTIRPAAEGLVQRRLEVEVEVLHVPDRLRLDKEERAHAEERGDERSVHGRPCGDLLLRRELARLHEQALRVEPIRLCVRARARKPAQLCCGEE